MKRFIVALALCLPIAATAQSSASEKPVYYGTGLCAYPEYECVKIQSGQTWEKLFPDEKQRDLVQRINRSYNSVWPGKEIVVPRDLANATLLSLSPFPERINNADHEKQVIVDQDKLAWGAYDTEGQLVNWGPIASGSDKCSDSSKACRTLAGIFRIFSKENSNCKSDIFPIGKGGAKMPYCMYFHKGFAMHGSTDMPGYRASHGCVRMFIRDAKWLNEDFVEISNEQNQFMGTIVVVRAVTGKPYSPSKAALAATDKKQTYAPSKGAWSNPDSASSTLAEKKQ